MPLVFPSNNNSFFLRVSPKSKDTGRVFSFETEDGFYDTEIDIPAAQESQLVISVINSEESEAPLTLDRIIVIKKNEELPEELQEVEE